MQVLFLNNGGAGFADFVSVEPGTTIERFLGQQLPGAQADDLLIRVNRQPVSREYQLQEGDRVSAIATLTAIDPSHDGSTADNQVTTYIYAGDLDPAHAGSPVPSNRHLRAIIYPDSDDTVVNGQLDDGPDATYDRIELTYHANGALHTRTDQREIVLTHTYDDANRRTSQHVSAGTVAGDQQIDTTYTDRGQLDTVTTYSDLGTTVTSELTHSYDGFGQLASQGQDHKPSGGYSGGVPTVTYNRDVSKGNRLAHIEYPGGRKVHQIYGPSGSVADDIARPIGWADDDGFGSPGDSFVEYHPMGSGRSVVKDYPQPEVHLDLWGGTPGSYAGLDDFGRIVDHHWENHDTPATLARIAHGYDRASNRLYRENSATTGRDELYDYDDLHRLVNTERGDLNAQQDGINNLGFAQNWTLDQLGNWNAFNEDTSGSGWDLEQTRTHNDVNEITGIGATTGLAWADPAHDEAGNMTTMPQPYDLTESYTATYDAWNRLIEIEDDNTSNTVAVYRYDGQHRRIVAQVFDGGSVDHTRHFHYSAQWQVIEERVDAGTGGNEGDVERQFIWGLEYIDKLIVRYRDTSGNGTLDETLYVVCDTNYRITALVSDSGTVVERYHYSPYGQRTVLNDDWSLHTDPTFGSHAFHYGHQGLRHDPETGLVYNRNRYLHTNLGRFGQRDPAGYVDGISLYQYLRSNPIRHVDFLGTFAIGIGPTVGIEAFTPIFPFAGPLVSVGLDISYTTQIFVSFTHTPRCKTCDTVALSVMAGAGFSAAAYTGVAFSVGTDMPTSGAAGGAGGGIALPAGHPLARAGVSVDIDIPSGMTTAIGTLGMGPSFYAAVHISGACVGCSDYPWQFAERFNRVIDCLQSLIDAVYNLTNTASNHLYWKSEFSNDPFFIGAYSTTASYSEDTTDGYHAAAPYFNPLYNSFESHVQGHP